MRMSNTVYDRLKWLALIGLPAVAVLLQGLGELYGFSLVEEWVGTVNLFAVFLGSLLQLSSQHYQGGGGLGSPNSTKR